MSLRKPEGILRSVSNAMTLKVITVMRENRLY